MLALDWAGAGTDSVARVLRSLVGLVVHHFLSKLGPCAFRPARALPRHLQVETPLSPSFAR